jgi:hypothetical protein
MRRIPRPVLRALEALAQSPINTSALAMAEGQDFAHDTLYRALNQPLASFFLPGALQGHGWPGAGLPHP